MTIEDIIRRIVREELAAAAQPQQISIPIPQPPLYVVPPHICAYCGGSHGGLMCPHLRPSARDMI